MFNTYIIHFTNEILLLSFLIHQLIATRFQSVKQIELKSGQKDLVTETDQEVENLFINRLSAEFPDHRFANLTGFSRIFQ